MLKNMKNRTLKRQVVFSLTLLGIIFIMLEACGTIKEATNESCADCYTVKYIPNSENYYEGNIIVEVLDEQNRELKGALVTILSDDKKLSKLELKNTSKGVFYKEEKNITVLVSKDGFKDVKTSNIAMFDDKACLISVRLPEK